MRLAIMMFIMRLKQAFDFSECQKESLGYRCQHRVYPSGFVECGKWSKVREV